MSASSLQKRPWASHKQADVSAHQFVLPLVSPTAQVSVKLVGATVHYVAVGLDAGPIIEQRFLARGARAHLQDRMILHTGRAEIFLE